MPFRDISRMSLYLNVTTFCDKAQICDIHLIITSFNTHQEIFRFDVAMNNIFEVNIFETMKKLIDQHQHCFKRESSIAKIEKILQTRSQKIEHHNIIFAFEQILMNEWNIDIVSKRLIDIDFEFEKKWIFTDALEFNDNLFVSIEIGFWSAISFINLF